MIPTNELVTKLRTARIKSVLTNVFVGSGGGSSVDGTLVNCGEWNLSTDVVPQTGGTGAAGAIKKGNRFYVRVGGVNLVGPDGGPITAGFIAEAAIDTPGINLADTTKWYLSGTITA